MHIFIWVLYTSPKLHLWQNALNSLRFEPVLGPWCVLITHPVAKKCWVGHTNTCAVLGHPWTMWKEN